MITAAIVTTGEKSDGKYLQSLIEKSKETGMKVDTVIGDTAYSEKANIEYTNEKELALVAKLNPILTQGPRKEEGFEFNKDAGMYVCKAGHLAIRKARTGKKERAVIKARHIILILRNARSVQCGKAVTRRAPKARHTR
jgi:hypothetical protein